MFNKNHTNDYIFFNIFPLIDSRWCNKIIFNFKYCRSGDIHEVLIFARRTNSRIQESPKNYYYNNAS